MIYCQGYKISYDKSFLEPKENKKIGRMPDFISEEYPNGYPGGSVWQTEAEARACCPAEYDVYGVMADWEKDTVPSNDGDYHDLLVDSVLVKLN